MGCERASDSLRVVGTKAVHAQLGLQSFYNVPAFLFVRPVCTSKEGRVKPKPERRRPVLLLQGCGKARMQDAAASGWKAESRAIFPLFRDTVYRERDTALLHTGDGLSLKPKPVLTSACETNLRPDLCGVGNKEVTRLKGILQR
jgi:hypothetical protein